MSLFKKESRGWLRQLLQSIRSRSWLLALPVLASGCGIVDQLGEIGSSVGRMLPS